MGYKPTVFNQLFNFIPKHVPSFIHISDGKMHDAKAVKGFFEIEPDSTARAVKKELSQTG